MGEPSVPPAQGKTILIVDDQESLVSALERFVQGMGGTVVTALSCREARERLAEKTVDLVLLDMKLPDGEGIDLLRELKPSYPALSVICMTGHGKVEVAVEAMRLGARDFMLKPFDSETLARSVRAVFGARVAAGTDLPGVKTVVGESRQMREVWRQIDLFALTDITILLLGESGTGKELFARAIHAKSKRNTGPFIALDCASIPSSLIEAELFGHEKGAFTDAGQSRPGKFELASGGTLFLDELGNLSADVQAKLLRVVQERMLCRIGGRNLVSVDVRLVGATHVDLQDAVKRGLFRNDLYHRLAEMPVTLPPLRDRHGDIPHLVQYFIREYSRRYARNVERATPEALEALERFSWPGNVRELENVIRAAVLQSADAVDFIHLPAALKGLVGPGDLASSGSGPGTRADSAAGLPPARGLSGAGGAIPAGGRAGSPPRHFTVEIPWAEDDSGIDVKGFLRQVKADLEKLILAHLVRERRMSKAQMARYLDLDYKVLIEKLKDHGLTGLE